MNSILSISLDVTKIDKAYLKQVTKRDGSKAVYLDLAVLPNREGVNEYGHCAMVVQGISKEAREQGEKGPILGNAKEIIPRSQAPAPAQAPARQPHPASSQGDDIPF
jgi:hypothetical protein